MQVTNNSPSAGYIAWSDVHITYKGSTYSILNGNSNLSYIYWKYSDPTHLYASNTFPTLGSDDLLVFLNKNGTHTKVPTTTIIDGSLIVPESIIANALSANSVTGEKILAGSIDATHIKTGSITGTQIKADSLTADLFASVSPNLALPGWDNMDQLDKSQLTSATGNYGGLSKCELSTAAYLVGKYSLWTQNNAANSYKYLGNSKKITAAAPGERFIASIYACTAQTNVQVSINVVPFDAAGVQLTTYSATFTINQGAWYRLQRAATMPANTASVTVYVRTVTSTVCDVYYDAFQLEKCEDVIQTEPTDWRPAGATVVNGGNITARSISASAIVSRTLTANEIATGTITANEIKSKSITADRLSVSSLSALSADLGTVTAGSISGVYVESSTFYTDGVDADGHNNETTIEGGTLTNIAYGNNAEKYELDLFGGYINISSWTGGGALNKTAKFSYNGLTISDQIFLTTMTIDTVNGVKMSGDELKLAGASNVRMMSNLTFANAASISFDQYGNVLAGSSTSGNWNIRDSGGGQIANFYFDPAAAIKFNKVLDMTNHNIEKVNHITISDPGNGEGIEWLGGSGWIIHETDDAGTGQNAANPLQFFTGSVRRFTVGTTGNLYCTGTTVKIQGSDGYFKTDGNRTYLYNETSGASVDIGKDSTGTRLLSLDVYNRTYSNASNVFVSTYGVIGRSTSASKYKLLIEEKKIDDPHKILALNPKTWYDKRASESLATLLSKEADGEVIDWDAEDVQPAERCNGLIAEDVIEAGLGEFVIYGKADENGQAEPEGLMYDRLWIMLLPVVKELRERVAALESQLTSQTIA